MTTTIRARSISRMHIGAGDCHGRAARRNDAQSRQQHHKFWDRRDAHVRLPVFSTNGDTQRLALGAYFNTNTLDTTFIDAAPSGTHVRQTQYEAGGTLAYRYNTFYVQGNVGGLFGSGDVNYVDGSGGHFHSDGYRGQVIVGNVFGLFNALAVAPPTRGKAGAPTITGGYDVNVDLAGRFTFNEQSIGAFTDSSGFVRGQERLSTEGVGGRVRLSANVYDGGSVWTPYIAATLDQQIDYSHRLFIPTQASVTTPGDVDFASPNRTQFGAYAGVSVLAPSGVRYGVEGFYAAAHELRTTGLRAYVRLPLWRLLGLTGPA